MATGRTIVKGSRTITALFAGIARDLTSHRQSKVALPGGVIGAGVAGVDGATASPLLRWCSAAGPALQSNAPTAGQVTPRTQTTEENARRAKITTAHPSASPVPWVLAVSAPTAEQGTGLILGVVGVSRAQNTTVTPYARPVMIVDAPTAEKDSMARQILTRDEIVLISLH